MVYVVDAEVGRGVGDETVHSGSYSVDGGVCVPDAVGSQGAPFVAGELFVVGGVDECETALGERDEAGVAAGKVGGVEGVYRVELPVVAGRRCGRQIDRIDKFCPPISSSSKGGFN